MAFASGPIPVADALAGGQVARRFAAQAAALGGLLSFGALLAYGSLRIPFICPLRMMTGVPCPLCGMTTGTNAFLRGDLRSAAAANPLSLLFVPSVVLVIGDRLVRLWRGAAEIAIGPRARRVLVLVAAALAAGSWAFQMLRFGLIG